MWTGSWTAIRAVVGSAWCVLWRRKPEKKNKHNAKWINGKIKNNSPPRPACRLCHFTPGGTRKFADTERARRDARTLAGPRERRPPPWKQARGRRWRHAPDDANTRRRSRGGFLTTSGERRRQRRRGGCVGGGGILSERIINRKKKKNNYISKNTSKALL